MTYVIMFT